MEFEVQSGGLWARFTAEVEQDIQANRSSIRITKVEAKTANGSTVGSSWMMGSISINGENAATLIYNNTKTCYFYLSGNYNGGGEGYWNGYEAKTITVQHDGDGTKTITVKPNLNVITSKGIQVGEIGPGIEVELPRIPRVSSADIQSGELGEEMRITLHRASDDFTDSVYWECGDETGTIATRSRETEFRWVPDVVLANHAPTSEAVNITIIVHTFTGDEGIGYEEHTVSCRIPDSIVPAGEMVISDRMGYSTQYGGYIQNQSQARVQAYAAGTYGATIKEILIVCGIFSASGETVVFTLPNSGTIPVKAVITDSRGRSRTLTDEITVKAYSKPAASITGAYRCDGDGNSQPDGGFLRIDFDSAVTEVTNGTAVYRAVVAEHDGGAERTVLLSDYTGQFRVQGGSVVLPAAVDEGFDCRIQVQDSFQAQYSGSVLVPVAFALLDLHRAARAVGIGMRANRANAVSVGLDVDMTEHRICNLVEPVEDTDAATKGYVDFLIRQYLGSQEGG